MAAGLLKEAEAEVARAEAALNMAQQFLRDTLIKAPYSGIIISTHIVPGSYTRTGDPIVTMLNDDDLEIEADIPTVRALNLVPNMRFRENYRTRFRSKPLFVQLFPRKICKRVL